MIKDPLYGYRGKVRALLENLNVKVGDRIKVVKGKLNVEGLLMPRELTSEEGYITIKLDNGYNIGVKVDERTIIEKVEWKEEVSIGEFKAETPKIREDLPRVTIVSTGGTIASRVDYRTGAVHPALSSKDIISLVPEISEIASIRADILFSILSENMRPHYWAKIAEKIAEYIRDGVNGVVVTHGTDTMSYTAAALSFALRDLPVPVVLVGSQRSSDRPSSDAAMNLISAVTVAAKAPFAEVVVVMHGESSDTYALVHRGTKVRKMHTSRRDAFKTINDTPLAKVENGKIIILNPNFRARDENRELKLENKFEEKVFLLKTFPGISGEIIDFLVDSGYRGIVIEGTGLGHAPEYIMDNLKRAIDNGVVVVMTSQCLWGRINMNVYSTGRELLRIGVIPGEDILPEVALVKLMWILAKTRDPEEARRMFLTNYAGEFTERTLIKNYI